MEEDILQQKRDNDRSCLVGVLGAFDCFQLVDNVHILDQEDHNLENDDILLMILENQNCDIHYHDHNCLSFDLENTFLILHQNNQ